MDKYMKNRMDDRDDEDFRTDISQFTEKEMLWGKAMRKEFTARGRPCSVGESGVDNTGGVIYGKLPNYNPDKIFVFHDGYWMYIEIKTIPESHNSFHTFKTSALNGCLHYGATILVPKKDYYFLYGKKAIELVLERSPRLYVAGFGDKLCSRASMTFINHMVEEKIVIRRNWTSEAKKFIEGVKAILTADRITRRRTGS